MATKVWQIDAFTATAFQGNPAAVCILPGPGDAGLMQQIAAEMNLSETAFLYRQGDGFALRWFTPVTEVKLCGHATLASAHALYESGLLDRDVPARFYTASGLIIAEYAAGWISLSLPAYPPQPAAAPGLLEALAVSPLYIGRNLLDYLVVVESEAAVREVRPDFGLLARAAPTGGVIVTSRASLPGYDFVCRYFDPAEGINEDPVTGSAFSCLGPYWHKVFGREVFVAYQASQRGGTVKVRVAGDRVVLSGQAVTVLRGEMLV